MDDLFSAAPHNSSSSIVSTAAAVAGVPLRPEQSGVIITHESSLSLVGHTSHRWQEKGRQNRISRGERDDLKKFKKMKIDKYDEFCEWVDGDHTLRYRPKDPDARKHLSGWAMRNTNNHNKKVLKKSCLGVFLCSKGCMNGQGDGVTVRPATSDRARRKQMQKTCPRPGCGGKLYHKACGGKNGYPVTHFWRVTDVVILFQSKGTHDHPRPDVVKTTSMAKIALLEYHRTHRHERPKEICRKVGIHLHKSFNRVDRVARQLREVQAVIPKEEKENNGPYHNGEQRTYSLRAHVRGLFTSPQKGSEAEQYGQQAMHPYGTRHPYSSFYNHDAHMDTWSPYATADYAYAAYAPNEHFSNVYQTAAYSGYATEAHELSPYEQMKIETYAYDTSNEMVPPHLTPVHDVYSHVAPQSVNLSTPRDDSMTVTCHSNVMDANSASYTDIQQGTVTTTLLNPTTSIADTIQPIDMSAASVASPVTSSIHSKQVFGLDNYTYSSAPSLKRPAPPELQPLQPALKHQKTTEDRVNKEHSTIKLTEHTPSINIDLSHFADIFDIGAGMGDEGLAGRPKPPVYQALSPVSNDEGNTSKHCCTNTQETVETHGDEDKQSDVSSNHMPSPHRDSSPYHTEPDETMGEALTNVKAISVNVTSATNTTTVSSSQESPVFTQLGSSTTTTPSTAGGEADLDLLVSMYLSKDADKPISHMKNEFHVYTEKNHPHSQLHPKSYGYRQENTHYSPHEFFRTTSSSVGQYDFGWYEMERRNHAYRPSALAHSEGYYPSFSHTSHVDNHSLGSGMSGHYSGDTLGDQSRLFYSHGSSLSARYNRHIY